jgi:hypothetical protein
MVIASGRQLGFELPMQSVSLLTGQSQGECIKRQPSLARQAASHAVLRLIELMDSEDERVATVACN